MYRIDDADRIIFVNDEWDRFAADNNGESVAAVKVLERPLWEFVSDGPTRELYRQILRRIREGRLLRFTFRCDSPGRRRLLEMSIERREGGLVQFTTRTMAVEEREPPALLTAHRTDPNDLLRVCGWCKKVFVGHGWFEVEEAVVELRLFERPIMPGVTHGMCEPCGEKMMESLASLQGP